MEYRLKIVRYIFVPLFKSENSNLYSIIQLEHLTAKNQKKENLNIYALIVKQKGLRAR